jgi:HSP20 family protein
LKIEVKQILSEDKKKMYYYYGGKEKKAGEIRKQGERSPYVDTDRMIEQLQRDFWNMPPRWRRWMRGRAGFPMMPFKQMMASVDVEDRCKDFRVMVDLPGFIKEDVNIEVAEDFLTVQAKKSQEQEERQKNYVRKERMAQTFYRRIALPEKVKTDDAKASLNNGVLEIILPKKEPKETKKLQVT